MLYGAWLSRPCTLLNALWCVVITPLRFIECFMVYGAWLSRPCALLNALWCVVITPQRVIECFMVRGHHAPARY
jgi:hypothetical protein